MRTARRFFVASIAAFGPFGGCTSGPEFGPGGLTPELTADECAARLAAVRELAEAGELDRALEEVEAALLLRPPESGRRQLQQLGQELRRDRFYRAHPLHLAVALDSDRHSFGDTVRVELRVANLGSERLTLPAAYRSFGSALLLQPAERSVLLLQVTAIDADGLGSEWGEQNSLEVPLEDDLELAPGGSAVISAEVPAGAAGRARFRLLDVGAIYRPIAIVAEGGERRYEPLEFPRAATRVFRAEDERAAGGGLAVLAACLGGESLDRPEQLFLSAVGLPAAELPRGVELLARAAPSLDRARQRAAMAALERLLGRSFGGDPVRALGFWEGEGRGWSEREFAARAGLGVRERVGELEVGR